MTQGEALTEMIQRVRDGDESAWEVLFGPQFCYPMVAEWADIFGVDPGEVLALLKKRYGPSRAWWQACPAADPARTTQWIKQTMKWVCQEIQKRNSWQDPLPDDDTVTIGLEQGAEPGAELTDSELRQGLDSLLVALKQRSHERSAQIIELVYWEECEVEAIAERLGITKNNVSTTKSRNLRRLREMAPPWLQAT